MKFEFSLLFEHISFGQSKKPSQATVSTRARNRAKQEVGANGLTHGGLEGHNKWRQQKLPVAMVASPYEENIQLGHREGHSNDRGSASQRIQRLPHNNGNFSDGFSRKQCFRWRWLGLTKRNGGYTSSLLLCKSWLGLQSKEIDQEKKLLLSLSLPMYVSIQARGAVVFWSLKEVNELNHFRSSLVRASGSGQILIFQTSTAILQVRTRD